MTKRKRHQVKEGSRLKLQNGNFARVLKSPKGNDTVVTIAEYVNGEIKPHTIPVGQIDEVVRF